MTTEQPNHPVEGDLKKPTSILFWILHVIAMIPILIVTSIPFSDYSNHLARITTIVRDGKSPLFPTMYHTNFQFRPYLGFDAPAWLLSQILSPDLVGKVFVLLTLTLWNFGLFRLARSRGNFGLAGCLPVLLTYNMLTIQGFLPYMMGLSLIPWYLIVFSKSSPVVKALPLLVLFPMAIFTSHQLALLVFILGGFCLLFDPETNPAQRKFQVGQLAVLFLLNIVYFKMAKFGGSSAGSLEFGGVGKKIHNLIEAFLTGSLKFDLLYIAVVLATVAFLIFTKKLALSRLSIVCLAIPFALFIVFPVKLGLAENIDYRFVLYGLSLSFAFLIPKIASRKEFQEVGIILIALVGARTAIVAKNFRTTDVRLAEAREAMKKLPGTPAIIVATVGEHSQWESSQWKPMAYSVANFAAVDRTAYVNTVFQEPSMMTISHGDIGRAFDYVGRANGKATVANVQGLLDEAKTKVATGLVQSNFQFYVMVVSTDLEELPKLPGEVAHGSYFSLYEVGQITP